MRFVIEQLLGILRPINPLSWPTSVRRLRSSEGWVPPMMLIATMGSLVGINVGVGIFGQNAFVVAVNYFSVATWFAVGSITTTAVLLDSIRNLSRYGSVPFGRPRWWFEVSRSMWLITLVLGLTLFLPAIVPLPVADRCANAAFIAGPFAFGIFVVSATSGFITSAITGRPRRGLAYECVQYFYVFTCVFFGVGAVLFWLPRVVPIQDGPLTVATCLIAASLLGIFVLKISERMERRAEKAPNQQTEL